MGAHVWRSRLFNEKEGSKMWQSKADGQAGDEGKMQQLEKEEEKAHWK